ncbi:glycoside hydrolase family 95 protein [Paenibacillus sp. GD4]|uniref:glycoside hydrolase family 95 protein n=1 Tax=Paenibacillus sp. GD4 TaxID=3068890 RepID=UPI002796D642|nr:glycoside hydrolase family 95 protein [Paenibacillus sp. GD4]MDQ1913921.1 glycoside hydrolase family 95 protein [Paenibacillus sp. GD4]
MKAMAITHLGGTEVPAVHKSRSHLMSMTKPAVRWQDALPGGNGTLGALVYGGIAEETVLINHEALWYGGKTTALPDLSVHLAGLRELLAAGKYAEANRYYSDKMKEAGYKAATAKYQPGFGLKLFSGVDGAFRQYRRTLDMETGEITVEWTDNGIRKSRRLFVSRPDDMVVLSIQSHGASLMPISMQLILHDAVQAEMHGFTHEFAAEQHYLHAWGRHENGSPFCSVARIIPIGGENEVQTDRLVVNHASEIVILLKMSAASGDEAERERLKRLLDSSPVDYDALLERHSLEHRALFLRAGIDLDVGEDRAASNERLLLTAYEGDAPTALVERMYDYGRYLLLSSSRPNGLPANLQGIWNGDYTPAWSSAFFNNENIQMNYWQALSGNLAEAAAPFYDFFDSLVPDMRRNAKSFYGCRGILSPLFASPESGLKKNLQPHVVYWTAGAGWLAQHYFDYWLFTGDVSFLQERALPFLKECALFYEDFLIEDENGKWLFSPSNSPENHANGSFEGCGKLAVSLNATMDVAIAREVLSNLCEVCRKLGIEAESLPRWEALLQKLPDYQVNEDGAMREWLHPDFKDNYHHRHQSHIYPLFPGFEITEETNPSLFEACRIAVEKRLIIGLSQQTGWSLAHMANIYARLGDGDRALECLDILSRSCLGDNLFTYHNDWRNMGITMNMGRAPFQIDANFGWTAAMQEMLLFSAKGLIKLLPALPKRWMKGEFRQFRCRGGMTVSLRWNMAERHLVVTLASDTTQQVEIRFPGEIERIETDGHSEILTSTRGSRYRLVKLNEGITTTWNVTLRPSEQSMDLD